METLTARHVPSSLDPLETSVSEAPLPCSYQREFNDASGIAFRHSGWHARRMRTFQALYEANVSAGVLDRFADCGAAAWLVRSRDLPVRYRIVCNRCRNRWCLPCQQDRACQLRKRITPHLPLEETRFITLTLRSVPGALSDQLDRLYACFRKLRNTPLWRTHVQGGVAFLELTLNEATEQWHPHLHVLARGSYLRQRDLSDAWHRITGDSFIVDIRRPRDLHDTLRYLTTYVTKSLPNSVTHHRERFIEAILALRSRRFLIGFGCLAHLPDDPPDDDPTLWDSVCPISQLLTGAKDGNEWCLAVLAQLQGKRSCQHPTGPSPPNE